MNELWYFAAATAVPLAVAVTLSFLLHPVPRDPDSAPGRVQPGDSSARRDGVQARISQRRGSQHVRDDHELTRQSSDR